tara:strand:+ start:821 stop:1564 length:744 start_codon:yes stop_codon:yes gene_type:complete
MEFTLPSLSQQSFSRWYNKKVPRPDNIDERIVYPGTKLQCTTKSRDLRSEITAGHIFITHEQGTDTFHHKVLGSNNIFAQLPKRLYSHCFHNISIHSIPPNNRITVRLTENTTIVLPYIPDDFLAQKRMKRGNSSRKTRGTAKKIKIETAEAQETSQNKQREPYIGWITQVMSPDTNPNGDSIDAFRIMAYIHSQLKKHDEQFNATLPNPFCQTTSIREIQQHPDKQLALTTIIQFMHHYGRHFFLK